MSFWDNIKCTVRISLSSSLLSFVVSLIVKQYYFLLFLVVLVLYFPIAVMKEVDGKHIPTRSVREFVDGIWDTLQGLTSFYLIVYVLGGMFALGNPTITFVSYYLIKLTSLQSGIDSITSGLAGVAGVWIFTTYWINENWRYINYSTSIVCCVMGLLWLLVFYDIGGLMNPWFTIFIDIDQVSSCLYHVPYVCCVMCVFFFSR
jgi:hypothetical protein